MTAVTDFITNLLANRVSADSSQVIADIDLFVAALNQLAAGGGGIAPANPTATASDVAVNGIAVTYMRSDAAPAVQKATAAQFGLVKPDGVTITEVGGVISSTGGAAANPTATASDAAVNGVAATYMRSDAAPAVQKASAAQFGLVKPDGVTITEVGGVISSVGGGGGASFQPGYIAGNNYTAPYISPATGAHSANELYLLPFYCGTAQVFSKIGLNVTTAGADLCQLGVYNNANGKPTSLLIDAGQLSVNALGNQFISGLNINLTPGWYWLAANFNGNLSQASRFDSNAQYANVMGFNVALNGGAAFGYTGWAVGLAFGALPNPVTPTIALSLLSMPVVILQV